MTGSISIYILLWLCTTSLKGRGACGLRNVSLWVRPPVVERGRDVELRCLFDLQGAPLYAIKFYRGSHEFYRYSPADEPPVKTFPFTGLHLNLTESRASSVLVHDADYTLAGNLSCEVSTEAPAFSTSVATNCLSVVELPKRAPRIEVEDSGGDRALESGDRVSATCESAPARPAPSLTWFINDEPAMTASTRWSTQAKSGLEIRRITLDTRLLARHVADGPPTLRCTAVLGELYRETTAHVLGSLVGRTDRVRLSCAERISSAIWLIISIYSGYIILL